MKNYLAYLAVLVFVLGCKKNESYEYYYQKAEEKRIEIENLVKTFPCGDLSNWKVDALSTSVFSVIYYPVATIPNPHYLRLKEEYEVLINKAKKLDDRTFYLDYIYNPAIAIECVDGHPKVMTAQDYNLEGAITVLNTKIAEVEALTGNRTCAGTEDWYVFRMMKDCKSVYIPINKNDKALFGKINELQQIIWTLQMRIVSLDNTKQDCFRYENSNTSFEVVCENNKPIVKAK